MDFALFTRWMPAASSGASRPLSVASTASLRMADMRTMIEEDPSPRSSRVTRQADTVALVKPGRGSWAYQAKNSSRAMLYTRFVIGDETESSTRLFIRRHSVALSTTVNSVILNPLITRPAAVRIRICADQDIDKKPVCTLRCKVLSSAARLGSLAAEVLMNVPPMKQPSALLPLAMSVAALALVLVHVARFGVVHEADEGTAAHLWQLLMAGQVPVVAYFALKWLSRAPGQALRVLALQPAAALAACAPVYWFKL